MPASCQPLTSKGSTCAARTRAARLVCPESLRLLLLLLPLAPKPVAAPVARSAETAAAAAAAVSEMVSWLEESGAELSAVNVGTGVGGERGVRAERDFSPGETILRGMPTVCSSTPTKSSAWLDCEEEHSWFLRKAARHITFPDD